MTFYPQNILICKTDKNKWFIRAKLANVTMQATADTLSLAEYKIRHQIQIRQEKLSDLKYFIELKVSEARKEGVENG